MSHPRALSGSLSPTGWLTAATQVTVIEPAGDHIEVLPFDVLRSLPRKAYVPVPASGTNVARVPVCPDRHAAHDDECGRRIWMSNTYPGPGAEDPHRTVKVVPTPPVFGDRTMGTCTVPVADGLSASSYG